MTGMCVRHCDCSLCLPGHRAQMTRLHWADPPTCGIVCGKCGKWCRDMSKPCRRCSARRADRKAVAA